MRRTYSFERLVRRVVVAGLRAAGFAAVAPLAAAPRRVGAFVSGVAAGGGATERACSRDIKRDLRREAALRCTMPF